MSNQRYHDLARAVADALGEEWQYQVPEPREDGLIMPSANVLGPGGCGIHIGRTGDARDSGRVSITGIWPQALDSPGGGQRSFLPYRRPEITCAIKRGGASIAGDITNRLLPDYLPLWEEQVRERDKIAMQFALVRMAYDELAAIAPDSHRIAHNGRLSLGSVGNSRCELDLSYDTGRGGVQGSLDLCWVPFDKVRRIVQILGE